MYDILVLGDDGMLVYQAYRFRMYPDKEQQVKLNQFLGTSRFIYNHYLSLKERTYKEEGKNLSLSDLKKNLVPLQQEYPWLKEMDSMILRSSLDDLDKAYLGFFQKKNGYPKYKSKNNHESYRTLCLRSTYKEKEYQNIKVDLTKKEITLPKLTPIKIRGYRNLRYFPYKILHVTVTKEANRYYASVCVEKEIPYLSFEGRNIVGIDLGVKDLVITSDGIKYKALENIKKFEKKIKGYNKMLARSEKGSKNREKIKIKLARVYQKMRNARKYYTHFITSQIVKENDIIVCEKLKVQEMIMKGTRSLSRMIANSSLSEIVRQLRYKTEWSNKRLYQVDTYYPSSQICNHCGAKNEEVKDLSVRKYECKRCGSLLDRDINASINILTEGLKYYMKELEQN